MAAFISTYLVYVKLIASTKLMKQPFAFDNLSRTVWKRIYAWVYLFNGPKIIQDGFDKANGGSFEVFAPDNRYVFVSSIKHIKELDTAPDTVLSLQAASKQMLQPVYTMHGFNWFDRRGTEGVGFVRALRTLLTNNLPHILPDLGIIIRTRFEELNSTYPIENGSRLSPVYPLVVKLVVLSNALSFFGEDLTKNEQFMESALAYIEETLICAEIVRLIPKFLVPIVGGIIARRLKSHETVFNALLPIAQQRCQERDLENIGQAVPKHADCIQWIMATSPRQNPWTAKRIVHELMAIWFGSVHALSTTITFAIHDLCIYPEYVQPLREELLTQYGEFERTGTGLPLVDSFLKESARLTPVESMSTRRSALQPFVLSDGTKLSPGDWACTPVRAIMQSAKYYPKPLKFYGFRFADGAIISDSTASNLNFRQPAASKLSDINQAWHVWGTGRMACPGRYYASAVMKVIIGQIILNYDCKLAKPDEPRLFTWRSCMLPREKTKVIFTPC
ncbi:cytochrome P450 [Tricladium varicosporioides]|nr:cytochrome P450 [Hymenoscyphus varicosporioides]